MADLERDVSILAAPAKEQEEWAIRKEYPLEEMVLKFYGAVKNFSERLREAKMIDQSDEDRSGDIHGVAAGKRRPAVAEDS